MKIFTDDDNDTLLFTRNARKRLATQLLSKKDEELSKDERTFLSSLLDGIDGNVAKSVRAKASVKEVENGQNFNQLVVERLRLRAKQRGSSNGEIPTFDTDLVESEVLPGEDSIGDQSLDLDQIVDEYDRQNK